jgi:hypothetical protein
MASTSSGITSTLRKHLEELERTKQRFEAQLQYGIKNIEKKWQEKHEENVRQLKRQGVEMKKQMEEEIKELKELNAKKCEEALMRQHEQAGISSNAEKNFNSKKEKKKHRHDEFKRCLIRSEIEDTNGYIKHKFCYDCDKWDGENSRCSCNNRRMEWIMEKRGDSHDSSDSDEDTIDKYKVYPNAY